MGHLTLPTDSTDTSSICSTHSPSSSPSPPSIAALCLLSENLASIFDNQTPESYPDATIIVSTTSEVPIHRCILSARSPYFKQLFKDEKSLRLDLKEMVGGEIGVGVESLGLVLAYLYSGKVRCLDRNVCVCVDDECEHVGCRPAVDSMVEILYAAFVFQIPELVALYQRRLLDILDKVAIDDVLLILSVAKICCKFCERLLAECIQLVVKSDVDIITLEKALPHDILQQIRDSRSCLCIGDSEWNTFPDKHIKRIHRALDSDDVELVGWLLKEGHTTLDDAHALHYAVAYCDTKTTTEVLDLGLADVNLRNSRGDTVLHVAAVRKEPKIVVSLLTKGARLSDLTLGGRKAVQISKRLTRSLDYYGSIDEGKSPPKERLCIEILEQAERRDPLLGDASPSLAMAGTDLRMKLLYLENRDTCMSHRSYAMLPGSWFDWVRGTDMDNFSIEKEEKTTKSAHTTISKSNTLGALHGWRTSPLFGLAKLLFPSEAQVVMDIARVDRTSEFTSTNSRKSFVSQLTPGDLKNEAPFKIEEGHLNRMRALSTTVELGKRFFPRCSDVLNKIMDADDLTELAYLGNDTSEERVLKKRRYVELQDVLLQAFTEDKEELGKSVAVSPSSPSSSSFSNRSGVMSPPSSSLPSPSSSFKRLGISNSFSPNH